MGRQLHGAGFKAGLFISLLPVMRGKLTAMTSGRVKYQGLSCFTPLEMITAPKDHSRLAVLHGFHWKPRKRENVLTNAIYQPKADQESCSPSTSLRVPSSLGHGVDRAAEGTWQAPYNGGKALMGGRGVLRPCVRVFLVGPQNH